MEENNVPRPRMTFRSLWKEWQGVIISVVAVFVVFKLILQLAWVPSGSMETTIPTKSLLIGWHAGYLVSDPEPERGQIVTFWNAELDELLVKRVIGLPGDTITVEGGFVYVNGEKLDEWYLPWQGNTECSRTFEVPEGCFVPMGDNREGSFDARGWENPYIPISEIQARTLVAISFGRDHAWQGVRLMVTR